MTDGTQEILRLQIGHVSFPDLTRGTVQLGAVHRILDHQLRHQRFDSLLYLFSRRGRDFV